MLASPRARSSPSPSSPDGLASRAKGTSTAMQTPACEMPFLPCPIVPNSTAGALDHLDLIEEVALHLVEADEGSRDVLTKPWTVRRCPLGMPSAEAKDGWPGDADIGWSNSLGWYLGLPSALGHQTLRASSRVLASVPLPSRPVGGRDLLRHPASTDPWVASVGSAASGTIRGRQGLRGRRKP